jgi:hypothetical protein
MELSRNGKFTHVVGGAKLAQGLRTNERMPRNNDMMITCIGAVGRDQVLQVIEELDRIDTSIITDSFPYPQLFVFTNMIIICSSTTIYELIGGSLVSKIVTTPGSTWHAVDFHDYVYLSNGKVSVERDPSSREYSLSSLPTAIGMCNFNGQIIIGAPNVEVV